MLDAVVRRRIDPMLDRAGRWLAVRGVGADGVTLLGPALGLGGAGVVAAGAKGWALGLILASRLADGLDGAAARASAPTDFGGMLDICADFFFCGAVPLGFVLHDPAANGAAGATLLLAFYVNGVTFLGDPSGQARQRNHSARSQVDLLFSRRAGGTETFCSWSRSACGRRRSRRWPGRSPRPAS